MSSLAGALLPPQTKHDPLHASDSASSKEEDADMENIDDLKPSLPGEHTDDDGKDEDEQEELNDLFGGDEDVNMVEHQYARLSLSRAPS